MDQETKDEFETLTQVVKSSFDTVDRRFDETEKRFDETEKHFDNKIVTEIGKAKLEILDAMDDKLVNLKGDLILLMRGEDKKLLRLVNLLKIKNILTKDETEGILKMQPFPQTI